MTAYLPKDHASTEDKKRIADLIFCQKRTAVVLGNAITSVSVTMHKYFENCRENRMWTATFCQCDPFFCRVLARTCRLRTLSKGQHSGDSMNPSAVGFGGFYCSRRKLRNRPAAVSPLASGTSKRTDSQKTTSSSHNAPLQRLPLLNNGRL